MANKNEEIARKLGWRKLSPGVGSLCQHPDGAIWNAVPDFEHDWAHAGPLLDEMVRELGFIAQSRIWEIYRKHAGDTLTHAISRAWLAWKEEK